MSSSSYNSPVRSPGSSRLPVAGVGGGVGGVSRLRSSSMKKPPEPLRRAVADCLASSAASSHHATTSSTVLLSEASRILRDYLASPTTMDLSYNVILEHTIAERERSPAVVARCVALLKRYLLRYKPSEETLLQIDRFCVNTIAECDIGPNRKLSPLSHSVASTASTNIPPLSVPSFASGTLVKSLNYVRSLVSQHLPRRSFQRGAFSGTLSTTRQSLPSLSSLMSRSFNGQLSPAHTGEPLENRDVTAMSILNLSNIEKVDGIKDLEYIALDVLRWRWLGEQQSSLSLTESDRFVNSQEMRTYNLLEAGAAALLVGDVKAKMKGQPWKFFGTADMPYLDQLLQPSPVTAITDSSAVRAHLRAITATKRTKSSPNQIWDESPVSTFRPRAKPLFQYRHYRKQGQVSFLTNRMNLGILFSNKKRPLDMSESYVERLVDNLEIRSDVGCREQQPLRLNPAEVCEVIAAVCSEASSPTANLMTVSSRLYNNYGKPSMDAAVSVLIKLVIDMYVLDSGTAAPLTLSMLQEMLSSPTAACRVRAFDFILNLGVHAHLLEPLVNDDTSTIEEDYSQESYFDSEAKLATQEMRRSDSVLMGTTLAIDNFESWILNILYEILLLLVQIEEKEESVWASALSCLLYFVCDRGKILRNRINGLDIRVVKMLLVISRMNSWAEVVHCKLVSMLANMFYQVPEETDETVSSTRLFVVEQVDLIGGIEFIFYEYSLSKSRDERRNMFLVLFDYVIHQINEACIATGGTEYSDDEIQPLVTLLILADASEAVYICIKLGLTGVGELMRNSISDALCRYPNSERLNMLLESIMEKFGATISSFTHLDTEFFQMMQITESYKSLDGIEGAVLRNGVGMKAKLSWAILHSLLHSGNVAYHRNAYVWLGDLLIAEISDERNSSIWLNIKNMQQKISHAGVYDSAVATDVPVPIWLMCGLLKSRHSLIRWGFLLLLERLLLRCKILLNETKTQQPQDSDIGNMNKDNRLEKANAVIDLMSSALSLVFQINETDRMNILKMCDILFSQLCLKVPPAKETEVGDDTQRGRVLFRMDGNKKVDDKENYQDVCTEEASSRLSCVHNPVEYETESMAAQLLHGQAIVPMQLVTRVPAALFYWPLIQLAGAATDNVALGIAVGSKGRGNLPGATSDIRATLLLLLIGKCTADPTAFQEVGGEEFFRELLDDTDSRVAYYSSAFLLKRMMTEKPERYQHMLQNLVVRAQQSNNEKLLENPYLQMRGILQLANDLGTGL